MTAQLTSAGLLEEKYPTGAAKWILIITAISCALLELIDTTVVNVALREISSSIGATQSEIAWVVTSYGIANVIVIPLSAMLSNLFGRRLYFTSSVALFTFASFMCGLSGSLWVLVFWRFIQGIAGGGILSTAQSIIIGAFPPEKVATGQTIFGIGIILGPTFGPVMGGTITDHVSWHWVFFINVPIGITAAILSWNYVSDIIGLKKVDRIDWWGIIFLIAGIGSLQYVLEEGQSKDWFDSTQIVLFFLLSIFSLTAFVIRELRIDYPAVNLRLFKSYNLLLGNILNFFIGLIIFGTVFIFPLFTQVSLGWTATKQGVFMIPGALATAVGMIISGRLIGKGFNPKVMILTGLVMLSTFLVLLSFSGPDSNEDNFFWPFILRGFGAAFMMMPILGLAVEGLKGRDLAQATGLSNMLRQLGGAVGVALITLFLDRQTADIRGNMVSNVSNYNDATSERLGAFNGIFSQAGYSTDEAMQAANMMLDRVVSRQQLLVSYDHAFMALSMSILLCIPIILLIKYKKGKRVAVISEH